MRPTYPIAGEGCGLDQSLGQCHPKYRYLSLGNYQVLVRAERRWYILTRHLDGRVGREQITRGTLSRREGVYAPAVFSQGRVHLLTLNRHGGNTLHTLSLDTREWTSRDIPSHGEGSSPLRCNHLFILGPSLSLYAYSMLQRCLYRLCIETPSLGWTRLTDTQQVTWDVYCAAVVGETAYILTGRGMASYSEEGGWVAPERPLLRVPFHGKNHFTTFYPPECVSMGRHVVVAPLFRKGDEEDDSPSGSISAYDTVTGTWAHWGPSIMSATAFAPSNAMFTCNILNSNWSSALSKHIGVVRPRMLYPHPDMGWAQV
ncbi:hypothetical protein KIPB_002998 [Kipferlia bialata]|uniref:Kelch-type beta propeller n=1 Tax=Kipferlia bialata TaxID=797122 RepID=A0A391NPZ8_9EUKA|nr:hypothetical protein KIPB_002998 [Kipferlia bialata]|eukprot:g2998.t1